MGSDLVAVRGGGDLGSGVALRLWRCGFQVVVLETARPLAVRRTVAFAEAVYRGEVQVEEARGVLVPAISRRIEARRDVITVVVDPLASAIQDLRPRVVVDAIMAKRNTGTLRGMAPRVIGLGPGFIAGDTVHAVVETNRGPHLGRVIWSGSAQPNTGSPGEVFGRGNDRVLRAPAGGVLRARHQIGDLVDEGEVIACVDGVPLRAAFRGLVRGLLRDGLEVPAKMKVGDLDPRLDPALCYLVSDKALAVAGGVLEAILAREAGAN